MASMKKMEIAEAYFQSADIRVTGTVLDDTGEGLPGVSIIVEGTTVGVITDIDGKYSLMAPSNGVLVFSYVGFTSESVNVNGRGVIDMTMIPSVDVLSEVVIVGFGEQKKKSVVGSIVQTTGDELIKASTVPTISEALRGVLPGVTAVQNSGIPGASQANILIRGLSSWNNNSPLTLVDGIERDFNTIDINEIQSISVLKDASATAVYGVRGANGVILVTTKRGRQGDLQVNFTANYTHKAPIIDTDYFAPRATSLEWQNVALRNDGSFNDLVAQSEIDNWTDPDRDLRRYSFIDWVDELIGTGQSQRYNLNLSGGNEKVKYFTSLGYNYDGDIFKFNEKPDFDPRTWQKRYNFRTNLDISLTKSTEVSLNLSGDIINWNGNWYTSAAGGSGIGNGGAGFDSGQLLARFFELPQIGPPYEFAPGQFGRVADQSIVSNFRADMEERGSRSRRSNRLYSDFILKQDLSSLVNGLSIGGKLSFNSFSSYNQSIDKPVLFYQTDFNNEGETIVRQYGDGEAFDGPALLRNETFGGFNRNLYYEISSNYSRDFDKHNVSALLLFFRRQFDNGRVPRRRESWVGRLTYGFDDRYLFEVNGSYTGVSKFRRGKRFGLFPSAAIGWVLSEEDFLKDKVSWMDLFKIRYSWGQAGEDRGSPDFIYQSPYSENNFSFAGAPLSQNFFGIVPSSSGIPILEGRPANTNATWETSTKQNLGIELGFFDRRLTTTVEFFDEKRESIFMLRRAIPPFFGADFPFADIGRTKVHGIDIELGWQDDVSDKFSYWIKGNLSLTENRIEFRDDPQETPPYQTQAGKPIGFNTAIVGNGFLTSYDDVNNHTESTFRKELIPGDFRYIDYNADGVINILDRVPFGFPSAAQNSGAWSFGITYGNLSISARFNSVFRWSKNIGSQFLWASSNTGVILKNNEQLDYWTPDNQDAAHPAPHVADNHNNHGATSYSVRRSDFIRLQSAELSYNIPVQKVSFIKNARVFINGNGLYTWTNFPSQIDPESNRVEVFPTNRLVSVGAQIQF